MVNQCFFSDPAFLPATSGCALALERRQDAFIQFYVKRFVLLSLGSVHFFTFRRHNLNLYPESPNPRLDRYREQANRHPCLQKNQSPVIIEARRIHDNGSD
jgi:hypothetical protein